MKVAIISDIHEDIAGLQRALLRIGKLGVDEVACLGDISGFSVPHYHHYAIRNAHECLRLIKENCKYIIPGNHDLNACKRIPEISPEFDYPSNWFQLDYFTKKKMANGKLWLYEENELIPYYTDEDMVFLSNLPLYQVIDVMDFKFLFTHYIFPNLIGNYSYFCNTYNDYLEHFNFMQSKKTVLGFAGHVHPDRPFVVSKNKITEKRFGKVILPETNSIVVVPAIAGNKRKNGFCIFDSEQYILRSYHI